MLLKLVSIDRLEEVVRPTAKKVARLGDKTLGVAALKRVAAPPAAERRQRRSFPRDSLPNPSLLDSGGNSRCRVRWVRAGGDGACACLTFRDAMQRKLMIERLTH